MEEDAATLPRSHGQACFFYAVATLNEIFNGDDELYDCFTGRWDTKFIVIIHYYFG